MSLEDMSEPTSSKSSKRAVHLSPDTSTPLNSPKYRGEFIYLLDYLRQPLLPLVSCTTGQPHEDFPPTVLSYCLLTSNQLNDLAYHFHQIWPPVSETFNYVVQGPVWLDTSDKAHENLKCRRSRFGKFIGLPRDWLFEDDPGMSFQIEVMLKGIEDDYYRLREERSGLSQSP